LVGSVIATFTSWRVIYGVEAGMTLLGLTLAFFFIPKASEIENPKVTQTVRPKGKKEILQAFNPMNVFIQFTYPRILLAVRHFHSRPGEAQC
jgi:predicted MFS family arabinose efflux permease